MLRLFSSGHFAINRIVVALVFIASMPLWLKDRQTDVTDCITFPTNVVGIYLCCVG